MMRLVNYMHRYKCRRFSRHSVLLISATTSLILVQQQTQGFTSSSMLASAVAGSVVSSSRSSLFPSSTYKAQCLATSSATASTNDMTDDLGYLDAESAAALDVELMSTPGFTLEQLMELAGLSCAEAVYHVKAPPAKVLIICGPGNNGGDGLVAARHLTLFGYDCTVVYPTLEKSTSKKAHYANLLQQCKDMAIPVLTEMPDNFGTDGQQQRYDVVMDAIFGFSFSGSPRAPFDTILEQIKTAQKEHGSLIVSVDVPSGWNVDQGDVSGAGLMPNVLISLTAPKVSAQHFTGDHHFVGGRFLPDGMAKKYNIRMPPYPGVSQVMRVGGSTIIGDDKRIDNEDESWKQQYADYLADKERKEFAQYDRDAGVIDDNEPCKQDKNQGWEAQYDAHLREKATQEANKKV